MYKVGTLIAASLYQAGSPRTDARWCRRALLASYDDSTPGHTGFNQLLSSNLNTPENFTPEAVADIIAGHIADPKLKKELCNQLSDRLQLPAELPLRPLMPSCPATSARGAATPCPAHETPHVRLAALARRAVFAQEEARRAVRRRSASPGQAADDERPGPLRRRSPSASAATSDFRAAEEEDAELEETLTHVDDPNIGIAGELLAG